MECASRTICQFKHLLAAAQTMGGGRDTPGAVAGFLGATQRPAKPLVGRMHCRWPLGPSETGGPPVGKTTRSQGTPWMVVVDGAGTPLDADLDSASPTAVTLLEQTFDAGAVGHPGKPGRPRQRPKRLMADRGDDSHPRRARWARRGIEPIIPAPRPPMRHPSRWAPVAAASATVDRRADVRVAGPFSAPRGALCASAHRLCRRLASRLCSSDVTEGFEMTSSRATSI